jgi:hypothetical protein
MSKCDNPHSADQSMFLAPLKHRVERRPPPIITPGLGCQRKVGILGSHDTIRYAPWWDPSWELGGHWACRTAFQRKPDWYFDLHPWEMRHQDRFQGWRAKQRVETAPIWMCKKYPDVPASLRYPKERILMEFQPNGRNVFTNQASWMIALLLTQGVTKIGLFGINYGHEDERALQRDSLVYWMGRCDERGVEVLTAPGSTLLNTPMELYGYDSHDDDGYLKPCYLGKRHRTIHTPKGDDVAITPLKPGEDNPSPADLPLVGTEQPTSRRPGL